MEVSASVLTASRRQAAIQYLVDFRARYLTEDDVLMLVGSLAHGGFGALSDIDAVCLSRSSARVLKLVRSVGMVLSDAEFSDYRRRVDERYCILNFRTSFGGIPVSLVSVDLSCLSELATGLESMLQIRNYLPPGDVTLRDFIGEEIAVPRLCEVLGLNYLSNYVNFVVRSGVWGHGSLVNKLISKPVTWRDGVAGDLLVQIDQLFATLHAYLRHVYTLSREVNCGCSVLAPLARSPKFDEPTISHLTRHVYQHGRRA